MSWALLCGRVAWCCVVAGVWCALVADVQARQAQIAQAPAQQHSNFPEFLTPPSDIAFADWRALSTWPVRLGVGPEDVARQGAGTIMGAVERVDNALVRRKPGGRYAMFARDRELGPALKLWNQAFAGGPGAPLGEEGARIEGDNVFLVDSSPVGEDGRLPRGQRNDASMTLRYVSAQAREDAGEGAEEDPRALLHTAWFTVFEPASRMPTKGVVLLMPGLLATPEGTLAQLTRALNSAGWGVVRMVAQPSRFLERVRFDIAPDEAEQAGRAIAAVFDERGAECAYASQAALAFVEARLPAWRQLPRVAIGFSGGAMTLPTVVARDPDAYDGGVMIGGGCDFWLMTQTSNYNDWIGAVEVAWTMPPTDADRRGVDEAYLRASRLDSYHTAQALAGKPVLVMLGDMDQAVPAPLGELLVTRLEQAGARVTTQREPMGHEALFMTLPKRFGLIVEWLKQFEKAPADPSAPPPTQPPLK